MSNSLEFIINLKEAKDMNQEGFGIASGMVWAMSLAAASFGVLYALLVARLQRAGLTEGYTSFLVVLGVLATLAAAISLVGIVPVLVIIWLFVCSGSHSPALRWLEKAEAPTQPQQL